MKKETIINLLNENSINFPNSSNQKKTSVTFLTAYGFIEARIPQLDEYKDDHVVLYPSYVYTGGSTPAYPIAIDYENILSVMRTK